MKVVAIVSGILVVLFISLVLAIINTANYGNRAEVGIKKVWKTTRTFLVSTH